MAALNSSITTQRSREDRTIFRAMHAIQKRLRKPGKTLNRTGAVRQYLALNLGGYEHEVFSVLWLDTQHRLIAAEHLFVGTISQTAVYPREVVKRALYHNASAVILAHNHPSGSAEPSHADLLLTHELMNTLALVDVRVLDHFIVAGDKVASLVELDLLGKTNFPSKGADTEPQKTEPITAKQKSETPEPLSIGFEILTLRAHIRSAFALLKTTDNYASSDTLCDVGFALIDGDAKLNAIHNRIDAIGYA